MFLEDLLNSFTSSNFFGGFLYICNIMSSINNDSFTTYFPLWMPLVSFCYLAALDRTSSPMLNKSSESGHPCLAPDVR